MEAPSGTMLSEEEAHLYDRQIRLWGIDAQKKMRESKVLLVGLKGLNSEVCKNIALAGVHSVVILETEPTTYADLGAHLFVTASDVGKNRGEASIQAISSLNPLVKIEALNEPVTSKNEDFFKQFHVICASNCNLQVYMWIDDICRKNNILFFAADTFGFFGYFFSDLLDYTYSKKKEEEGKVSQSEAITVKFPSLRDAVAVPWNTLRRAPRLYFGFHYLQEFQRQHNRYPNPQSEDDFKALQTISQQLNEQHKAGSSDPNFIRELAVNASAEISPVCAIVGGLLGQEIIKAVSAKEPLFNFFLYDGLDTRRPGDVLRVAK